MIEAPVTDSLDEAQAVEVPTVENLPETDSLPAAEGLPEAQGTEAGPAETAGEAVATEDSLPEEELVLGEELLPAEDVVSEENQFTTEDAAAGEDQILVEDISVCEDPGAGDEPTAAAARELTSANLILNVDPVMDAAEFYRKKWMLCTAELSYDNEEVPSEIIPPEYYAWSILNDDSDPSSPVGKMGYQTADGEKIYLTFWTESGEMVDVIDSRVPIGDLTLKLIKDGIELDSEKITVTAPAEDCTDLTVGQEEPGCAPEVACKWFRFTAPKDAAYFVQCIRGDGQLNESWSIFTREGDQLVVKEKGPGGSFDATVGTEYLIAVLGEDSFIGAGTLRLEEKKEITAAVLKTEKFYNFLDLSKNILNIFQAEISYEGDAPSELITSWSEGYYAFQTLRGVENGNEISVELWDENGQINMPLREAVPKIGKYTLKLLVNSQEYDTQEIELGVPEDLTLLEEGQGKKYSLLANETVYYGFRPQKSANYRLCLSEDADCKIYLQDDEISLSSDHIFEAEAGAEYMIAVAGRFGYPLSEDTICIKEIKEIDSISLEAKSSYNIFTAVEELVGLQATVRYVGTDEEDVLTNWERDYWNGELTCSTPDGDIAHLTLLLDDSPVDLLSTDVLFKEGSYTLKLALRDKEATQPVSLEFPKNAELPETFDVAADSGEIYYSIPAQEKNMILHIDTTWGEGAEDNSCYITQYKEEEGTFVYEDEYDNEDEKEIAIPLEAGRKYWLTMSYYGSATVKTSLTEKKEIASVSITAKPTYSVFDGYGALRQVQATISYVGTTETETISGWGFYGDGLRCETKNGDTAYLKLFSGDEALDIFSTVQLGDYTLKVTLGDKEATQEVSFVLPEATALPNSFVIPEGTKGTVCMVPAQEKEMIMTIALSPEDEWILANWYKEKDGIISYDGDGELHDTARIYLDAGVAYWVVIDAPSRTATVTAALTEKLELDSVSGFTLAGSYSPLEAADAICAASTKITLNYKDGTKEALSSRWDMTHYYENEDDDYEDGNWCWGCTSENGNEVLLRLRKDGANVNYDSSDILDEGTYTVTAFVDGVEHTECSASFEVTKEALNAVEQLELDKECSLSLAEYESKAFRFTPEEGGEYTIYSSFGNEDTNAHVYLYDSNLLEMEWTFDGAGDNNFSLTEQLEAGRTYYYRVYGNGEFAVTLTRTLKVKDIKEGRRPTQTSFTLGEPIDLDLSMKFVYSDDTEQEIFIDQGDKFGNIVKGYVYPLDDSGEPDMDQETDLWELGEGEASPGTTYLVIAKACHKDEDGGWGYIPYEEFSPMSVTITIEEKTHVHNYTWQVSKAATCTEDGLKEYRCADCGEVSETEKIPATGHKKDAGTVTKAATCTVDGEKAYKCSVCETAMGTEKIPATGHTKVVDGTNSKAATCTTPGVTAYKCSVCGAAIGSPETVKATGHSWGVWTTVSEATVFAPEKQQRKCSKCDEAETQDVGSKLTPKAEVPAAKANVKTGQSTSVFNVGMAAGDSIVSVESSNTKRLKVASFDKTTGKLKLKAGKKTGKVKVTVTLASGEKQTITLTVQKKKVTTKSVKVTKNVTLKKGEKYTLKPVIKPITTQDKVKFKSSNKKVAAVSSKGVVTAKKKGSATITVTCGKKTAKCKVTVK